MSAAVWAAWLDSAGLRGAASSCLLPSALLRDIWEWGINWCDANCDASTESHSKCPLTLWACLSEAKGDLSPGFENSSYWQTVCHSQNWFKRVSSIYSPGEGLTSCWKSLSTAGPPRTRPLALPAHLRGGKCNSFLQGPAALIWEGHRTNFSLGELRKRQNWPRTEKVQPHSKNSLMAL